MMNYLKKFIDWATRLEEINGRGLCPTYLYRRTLLRLPWFAIYLHHFVGDDWSRDLHDHPKRFISLGLKGRYIEDIPNGSREYRAPWLRTFPAQHIHRLRLIDGKPCWTLVFVLRPVREWGFWHMGKWIHWREYVKSDESKKMKSCPD
jgi:hypothetical protein